MKSQSTTKGFAVLSAATIIVKIISLLYIPFLTVIIGKEAYGVYAATYIVFAFMYVITNSGIAVAVSKIISELIAVKNYRDAIRSFKIARFVMLVIGSIMAILMYVLAIPLAKLVHFPKAYLAIRALSPTVLITSVLTVYRGYFQGRGNMTPTAISQIIEQAINTIFSLLFAAILIKYGVDAGCAGATIGTSLGALVAVIYLIRIYEKNKVIKVPRGTVDINVVKYNPKQLLKKLLSYGVPIMVCVGLQNGGTLVDMANIKSRLLVAGFSDTQGSIMFGLLGNFNTLVNVPITIISALSAAVLPALSGAAVLRDKEAIKEKVNFAFRLCFLVAVPSAMGLGVLSKAIYRVLFPGSTEGYILMLYGAVVVILWSTVMIQTTILQSIGKIYVATLYTLIGIVAKIITNYILVALPSINIKGAIIGNIICFIIPLFLSHRMIKKTLKIEFSLYTHATKPLISAIFMGVFAYIFQYDLNFLFSFIKAGYISNAIAAFIAIGAAAFIYIFGLILVGGITKVDLNAISPRIIRFIPKFMIERMR